MRNHGKEDVCLDAETDQLGGSGDDGVSSSDAPIPEDFLGIQDRRQDHPRVHHHSSSSAAASDPPSDGTEFGDGHIKKHVRD